MAEIKRDISFLRTKLDKAPQGSIRFIKRKGGIQFYLRLDPKDKNGKYLRKSDIQKIKTYLQKGYDEKVLKTLEKEKLAVEKYLEKAEDYTEKIQEIYSVLPQMVKENIKPIDMSDDDYARIWMEIPYEKKRISEESRIFKTDRGEFVRSKSELTIANALSQRNIPYKYECPLILENGNVIHPDFTVLNVKKRKVFYWEHRGMMDDYNYSRSAVRRNKEYMKNRIYIGKDLIITEETLADPLGTLEIDNVINTYLV